MTGDYFIKLEFPFPVLYEHAVSRFQKQQHTLTITLPVVPPARTIQKDHVKAADIVLASDVPPGKMPTPFAATTSLVVDGDSVLETSASVTSHSASVNVDLGNSDSIKAGVTFVAKKAKAVTGVEAVSRSVRSPFEGYNKCMASFKNIKWNVDICRKESLVPDAGKGIFILRRIIKDHCVALYPGHLVDEKGAVVISCPLTDALFTRLPSARRPFSRSHGVYVNSVACPHILIVDGEFEYVAQTLLCIHVFYRQPSCLHIL